MTTCKDRFDDTDLATPEYISLVTRASPFKCVDVHCLLVHAERLLNTRIGNYSAEIDHIVGFKVNTLSAHRYRHALLHK